MPNDIGQAFALSQWLVRAMSRAVPRNRRREWLARQNSNLASWWILVQRGEMPSRNGQCARYLFGVLLDAIYTRTSKEALLYWMRGPGFLLAAIGSAMLALGASTFGFTATRRLLGMVMGGAAGSRLREDTLVGHFFPLVFALMVGVVLAAISPMPLRRSWRYWAFLAAKTAGVALILPVLWIESGAVLRAMLPRTFLAGFVIVFHVLAFVISFGWALAWSFADQRRRCPECLRLLAMPVSIGSWASVFEPATTELLCDEGHGSLSVTEAEDGGDDKWTALDQSWRDLFAAKPQ